MFANFIFDVDGTMVDSKDQFYNSLNLALKTHGATTEKNMYTEEIFALSAPEVLQALEIENADEVLPTWVELYNKFGEYSPLYDGVFDTIKELSARGKKVLIVTSRKHDVADPFFEKFNLERYVDLFVTADETVRLKPAPDPLLYALDKLGLDPNETLYIGDTVNDLIAARDAHIPFAAPGWNPFADKLECKHIATPTDLLNM